MNTLPSSSAAVNPLRTFTAYPRAGSPKSVETARTDAEAAALCEAHGDSFALDLAAHFRRFGRLSNAQTAWLHVKAEQYAAEASHANKNVEGLVQDEAEMDSIIALFAKASANLKKPAIELIDGDKNRYRLKLLGASSRYAGCVGITCGGTWLGRISTDGLFFPSPAAAAYRGLVDLLARFAADPAGVGGEIGRLTGCCCFCRLKLTDERSTEVGFGPVCAKNFGLAWGTPAAQSEDEAAARRKAAARKAVETRRARLAAAAQAS